MKKIDLGPILFVSAGGVFTVSGLMIDNFFAKCVLVVCGISAIFVAFTTSPLPDSDDDDDSSD
jgi:hypothetical protein